MVRLYSSPEHIYLPGKFYVVCSHSEQNDPWEEEEDAKEAEERREYDLWFPAARAAVKGHIIAVSAHAFRVAARTHALGCIYALLNPYML